MSLVLDSSVTLAWCFDDEHTAAAGALLERVVAFGAVAPALWPLEVLNALATAERRGRIDSAQRQRLAGFLHDLPVTLDSETAHQAWAVTARLAAQFQLTVYDAAYLELSQRLSLPLATLDQDLRAAGAALGIDMLGT